MKQKIQSVEFQSLLFGLTDEGVEFRNKWREVARMAVWLVLSVISMIVMIPGSGANTPLNIGIIIMMSFFKYIPLLMVVYNLARIMAARYLDDVYELGNEDLASDFLEEVTFGYGHERIKINEGKISQRDEESPIILIGGPGSIQVNLDSIALLEKVSGEPEVIYPRSAAWKIDRFERIREIGKYDEAGKREYAIINLHDQFISNLSIKSRTKDGIPITAQDIKVMFSILRREKTAIDHAQGDAYLFDERAVQALVYNQTIITPEPVTPPGMKFPWDTTILPLIISELEELITSHTLSEILATISQKEVDSALNNDQTIAQMRLEMTGQQTTAGAQKQSAAPKFKSRSMITAQFFEKEFKDKAAKLGVAIEWIDIGTWQMPSTLILDKHKEAWNLAQENAKKRNAVERTKKKHEVTEMIELVNQVIVKNYAKSPAALKPASKETEKLPDAETSTAEQTKRRVEMQKRDTAAIATAQEILRAFRKEMIAAKSLIEKDSRPLKEKQVELAKIEKALYDISYLTNPWVKNSP